MLAVVESSYCRLSVLRESRGLPGNPSAERNAVSSVCADDDGILLLYLKEVTL